MSKRISEKVLKVLACPNCGHNLKDYELTLKCSGCSNEFILSSNGQPDLRLCEKKIVDVSYELGNKLIIPNNIDFNDLLENKSPEVDFSKINVPWHLTKELLSYFPRAKKDSSFMLDLGCGNAIHKEVCEYAGFNYISIDYESNEANILGDAHALPFKDNSFEFILIIAVLEHIQYPTVVLNEMKRVLKSDGLIIGTVAFLEPFHSNSFYHFTHLGIYNSLKNVGFNVKKISPSKDWTVLTAQAYMVLFPRLKKSLSRMFVLPLQKLHKFWWKYKKLNESERVLHTTGAFTFIANKND